MPVHYAEDITSLLPLHGSRWRQHAIALILWNSEQRDDAADMKMAGLHGIPNEHFFTCFYSIKQRNCIVNILCIYVYM